MEEIEELQEHFKVLEEVNGRSYLTDVLPLSLDRGEFRIGKYTTSQIREQLEIYLTNS